MQKRWLQQNISDTDSVTLLSQDLNIHKNLAVVLANRGILNKQDAEIFFRPQLAHLHDPFLMAGMKEAVDRIIKPLNPMKKSSFLAIMMLMALLRWPLFIHIYNNFMQI